MITISSHGNVKCVLFFKESDADGFETRADRAVHCSFSLKSVSYDIIWCVCIRILLYTYTGFYIHKYVYVFRRHIRIPTPPLHMTGGLFCFWARTDRRALQWKCIAAVGSFGTLTEEMGCFVRPVNNLRGSRSRDVFEGLRDKEISVRSPFVRDVQTANNSHFRQQAKRTGLFCSGGFKGPLWKADSTIYR